MLNPIGLLALCQVYVYCLAIDHLSVSWSQPHSQDLQLTAICLGKYVPVLRFQHAYAFEKLPVAGTARPLHELTMQCFFETNCIQLLNQSPVRRPHVRPSLVDSLTPY